MADISTKLYQKIVREFDCRVAKDEELSALMEALPDYRRVHVYAQRLGEHLSTVLRKNISSDVLPDGKMYYNIADSVIRPLLENNRLLVNLNAAQVQEALNQAAGIGLRAITPTPNTDRVDGIINRLASEDNFDDVAWLLDEPVKTLAQSYVDDYIKANADFHARSGLSPRITRTSTGDCCEWCSRLAGTYEYSSASMPQDIFRRHNRCRCMVLYDPADGRGYQNSHNKQWYDSEEEARKEQRKRVGLEKSISATRKQYPINPVTGERYIDHDIIVEPGQFGKKVGKHALDYGLDPSDAASREWLNEHIKYIVRNAEERAFGDWRAQEYPVLFHIMGEDVVVESRDGKFVTLLKGGTTNERVKNARKQ